MCVCVCTHVCASACVNWQNGQHTGKGRQNEQHVGNGFTIFIAFVITKVKTDAGVLVPQKIYRHGVWEKETFSPMCGKTDV